MRSERKVILRELGKAALLLAALVPAVTACTTSLDRRSTGEVIDDSVIANKVRAAFIADKEVKLINLDVRSYDGTVQLSGFADTESEAARAVEIAKKVKGVREVKNDIRVKKP